MWNNNKFFNNVPEATICLYDKSIRGTIQQAYWAADSISCAVTCNERILKTTGRKTRAIDKNCKILNVFLTNRLFYAQRSISKKHFLSPAQGLRLLGFIQAWNICCAAGFSDRQTYSLNLSNRLCLDIETCVAYNLFTIKMFEPADISTVPFPTR
jgi:hypothetical protein